LRPDHGRVVGRPQQFRYPEPAEHQQAHHGRVAHGMVALGRRLQQVGQRGLVGEFERGFAVASGGFPFHHTGLGRIGVQPSLAHAEAAPGDERAAGPDGLIAGAGAREEVV